MNTTFRIRRLWRARRDGGSPTVELVVLAPLLIAITVMTVGCARLADARLRVAHSAAVAARAASLTRSASEARQAATTAARQATRGAGPACRRITPAIDVTDWAPGGAVRVRLSCTVRLADLTALHLPGDYVITSPTATSPIDRWRGAAP